MKIIASILAILLTLSPLEAFAHTGLGTVHDFSQGVVHPLIGIDHLLVMLAVGLWAALRGGKSLWLLPITFLTAMVAGAVLAALGITITAAESWVAGSVMVAGVLVGRNVRTPLPWALAIVALLAVIHGYVHALELHQDANAMAYAAGFLLTTALLQGLAIAVSVFAASRLKILAAALGVCCTVVGTGLLLMA